MGLQDRLGQLLQEAPAHVETVNLGETWWTWGQLGDVMRAVDQACTSAGLGAGARVGVVLRNRPEAVAVALGVLASGRCITTLNPMQPSSRLATDIARSAPPMVIGHVEVLDDTAVRGAIEAAGVAVVLGDDGSLAPAEPPVREWSDDAYSIGTAVEMMTSGTTGPPKRINLTYRQLDSAFSAQGSGTGEVRLSMAVAIVSAPLVHIGGLWHALNTVLAGRRLVLLDRFRVPDWVAAVEQFRPKVVSLVPAALQAVLDADVPAESLSSVTAVTSGTAACPPELIDAFTGRYGIPILTTYGATEFAGAVAGWSLADHHQWRERKRGSVGRAFSGVRIRAVDSEGDELPAGEVGQLQISAAQLNVDESWTSTSDLGSVDSDGFLFITGRADDAIVRGGFKVQPTTVQAALEKHPAVAAAAVAGVPDARLGKVPVAVVELVDGATPPSIEELLSLARDELVPYEVPVDIKIVGELPRTPSMKISRAEVVALFEDPTTVS
ncbi:MAG: class I adenylate-forming enzyme family protein [Aeromicrobium sp.]